VWEDPPRSRGRDSGDVDRVLALLPALVERPGTWARVAWFPVRTGAARARKALLKHEQLPAGRWEFRNVADGESASFLWAVYRGEPTPAPTSTKAGDR
jgi:hypothetical protein